MKRIVIFLGLFLSIVGVVQAAMHKESTEHEKPTGSLFLFDADDYLLPKGAGDSPPITEIQFLAPLVFDVEAFFHEIEQGKYAEQSIRKFIGEFGIDYRLGGRTALMIACRVKNVKAAENLIEFGANIMSVLNNKKDFPEDVAADVAFLVMVQNKMLRTRPS